MENEGILLRQSKHMSTLLSQLNDESFSETFGDIKLVFSDGHINSYKAILAQISSHFGQLVRGCQEADIVYMVGVKKGDLMDQILMGKEGLVRRIKDEIIDLNYHITNYSESDRVEEPCEETDEPQNSNLIPINDKFNIDTTVTDTVTINEFIKSEDLERSYKKNKMVSCILPDFAWPKNLNGPNFHYISWGAGKVFEVMGNRSIFTVLADKYKDLPCLTTFSVKCSREEKEKSGIFSLIDFVNAGAANSVATFNIEGFEKKLTLVELLSFCYDIKYKEDAAPNSKYITISIGGECKSLSDLTKVWKDDLATDTAGKVLNRQPNQEKQVMDWLHSQASRDPDGGEICCYCGLVCHEQSMSGNFRTHMRKHLFRKKKLCKQCKEYYKHEEEHVCTRKRFKKRKVPCTECDKILCDRSSFVRHLKSTHNIIDKVVVLRQCLFCLKQIPHRDISKHCSEEHKNQELCCQFCDKVFSNPTYFRAHVEKTHNRPLAGFCDVCQKEVWNLKLHNQKCHSETRYRCDHCEKEFKHPKTLEDHMKSVNGTREKKPCPECGNLYVNVNDHVRRFHRGFKTIRKGYSCTNCQQYVKIEHLDEHKLTCKPEETICHICSKKVVAIKKHLAMQHQVFDKLCNPCNKEFETTITLNNHLRGEHFPQMLKEAGFQSSDLQTEDKVQRELIATTIVELHSSKKEEGKIVCNLCGYKTITLTNMIIHMKEHMGFTFKKGPAANKEKEKVCPDCGSMYKYAAAQHKQICQKKLNRLFIQENNIQDTLDETTEMLGKPTELQLKESINCLQELLDENETAEVNKINKKTDALNNFNFSCNICDKMFKKQAYLRKHVKHMHTDPSIVQSLN